MIGSPLPFIGASNAFRDFARMGWFVQTKMLNLCYDPLMQVLFEEWFRLRKPDQAMQIRP
jgi:hypothetical protein